MKIYVHHKYTYELFWYFFHGVKVDPTKVPVVTEQNRYQVKIWNSNIHSIKAKYKGTDLDIKFVNDRFWEDESAHHIFDVTINSLQNGLSSDRMFILPTMEGFKNDWIPFLNGLKYKVRKNVHISWISWEGFNLDEEGIDVSKLLKEDINLYNDNVTNPDRTKYIFSQSFMSFIFPDTTATREYYFFYDWLKLKTEYEYKLLYPVRRVYDSKLYIANGIKKDLNENDTLITYSSFTDSNHYIWKHQYEKDYNEFLKFPNLKRLEKRGYNIEDFGGEWMKNNMEEGMWKMFGLAEVNLIHENPMTQCFSEKTICHILAGKLFLDVHYRTIQKIHKVIDLLGYDIPEYPLPEYDDITDIMPWLRIQMDDEVKWKELTSKLNEWLEYIRSCFLETVKTKNSLLDEIFPKLPKNII
jgi:hypothetical protein